MTRKILLKCGTTKATEPIISSIIKETGLLLNILYAQFSSKGGEILLAVEANDEEVKKVIGLFSQKGVDVSEIKRAIQLDHDICFDCGACISLCPTGALSYEEDKSVELDETKCIYCELCVPSCPVRALKLSKF